MNKTTITIMDIHSPPGPDSKALSRPVSGPIVPDLRDIPKIGPRDPGAYDELATRYHLIFDKMEERLEESRRLLASLSRPIHPWSASSSSS